MVCDVGAAVSRGLMRRVSAAVAVAVLCAGLAACGAAGPRPDPAPSGVTGSATPLAPPTETAAAAPDGGRMRVVEYGFSQSVEEATGKPVISYGIVFENTSRHHAAQATQVTIRFTDSAGNPTAASLDDRRDVFVTLPGQRMGIGETTTVDDAGAARMSVEVGPSFWYDEPGEFWLGSRVVPLAKVTASDVKTERKDTGKVILDFTVHSQYEFTLEHPSAHAIFRNSAGVILGGTSPGRTVEPEDYLPGDSPGRISNPLGSSAGTDNSRTEVYISPYHW